MKVTQIQGAEFVRNVFAISVPAGTKVADILAPECWMHVASKLSKGDRLEIYPEEGAYFAELIVVAAGKNWARVVLAREISLEAADTSVPIGEELYTKWSTPTTGFRVHRRLDKQVLKDGFPTKEEADKWIANFYKGSLDTVL